MSGYDHSVAELIRNTIHDAQDLVRGEIALAKAELRQEVRQVGTGAALLTGAAVTALIAVVFLLTAAAWAIPYAFGWATWTGFAIVGAVVLVAAGVMAMMGRKSFSRQPHMPLTRETLQENMRWT